ncbi:MAG TPA: serine hydrolase, partial [Ktedonobacteraceae bacterium]
RLEPLIQQVVASFEMAGLAIGIVWGDEVVYAKGFGVKHLETREPVTATSLFHLASVSKTFVATGIMQLVEQGKLDLDTPVARYLPYFTMNDERYRAITVQQMLSHVAGMPDDLNYHWDEPEYDVGALERYVRSLGNASLLFAPGERFAYSNIAYEVLGDVIAKVSGLSFEEYMRRHLLRPLGMSSSTFLKHKVPAELGVTPHVSVPQIMLSPVYPYHRAHAPSSTLHSSALEMCQWARANLQKGSLNGKRILSAASYDLLWHPYAQSEEGDPPEFVGLSWFLGTYRGKRQISHGGSDPGFESAFVLLPEEGMGVVVLANTIPAPVYQIRDAALDVLLGVEPQIPKPPVLVPLIHILRKEGVKAALQAYRDLQDQQPDSYDFGAEQFFAVGGDLVDIDRTSEAKSILEMGIAIDPEAAEGYWLLAWAYLKSGEEALALASNSQALQRNPWDRFALVIQRKLAER